jgi:hypothetical protein
MMMMIRTTTTTTIPSNNYSRSTSVIARLTYGDRRPDQNGPWTSVIIFEIRISEFGNSGPAIA